MSECLCLSRVEVCVCVSVSGWRWSGLAFTGLVVLFLAPAFCSFSCFFIFSLLSVLFTRSTTAFGGRLKRHLTRSFEAHHAHVYRLRVDDVAAGAKGREKLIPISLQHLMRRGHCEGPAVAATGIRRHLELHATWFTDFLRVTRLVATIGLPAD